MVWIVDYKDKTGTRQRTQMEADNRAIVISLMREKGCQVINITDGPSVASARKKARDKKNAAGAATLFKLLFALVLLALAGVAVWYYAGGDEVRAEMKEKVRPAGTVKINIAP